MTQTIGFALILILILAVLAFGSFKLFQYLRLTFMSTPTTEYKTALPIPSQSLTVRSLIIGVIVLVMLIPLSMVSGIVNERSYLYDSVLDDIANTWGQQQTITGPLLVVPFTHRSITQETITDKDGGQRVVNKELLTNREAIFLPKTLETNIDIKEEFRKRGIYQSLVYSADVEIQSRFKHPDVQALSENIESIHWDKAYLSIGLTDTRAINKVSSLNWDEKEFSASPGTRLAQTLTHGFHVKLDPLLTRDEHVFSLSMNVNGSKGIRFSPLGETTKVNMDSSWAHPSFQGSVLPTSRQITDTGFTAHWDIPHLARHYPQSWDAGKHSYDLYSFTTGVDMFEPVSLYSQMTRAVKYGILFIGLTFLTFLIFELTVQSKLHYVQYTLIGVAMALFFLVLLSLSEHIPFFTAYLIGSGITIGMITIYSAVALHSLRKASIVFALLLSLYIVLYSLLRLEDYALLMGTTLLLLVIMVLMFVTRNLNTESRALSG